MGAWGGCFIMGAVTARGDGGGAAAAVPASAARGSTRTVGGGTRRFEFVGAAAVAS